MQTLPWNEATEALCLTCRQVVSTKEGVIGEHLGRNDKRCPTSGETGVTFEE